MPLRYCHSSNTAWNAPSTLRRRLSASPSPDPQPPTAVVSACSTDAGGYWSAHSDSGVKGHGYSGIDNLPRAHQKCASPECFVTVLCCTADAGGAAAAEGPDVDQAGQPVKQRLRWTPRLRSAFMEAVDRLGGPREVRDHRCPTRIFVCQLQQLLLINNISHSGALQWSI